MIHGFLHNFLPYFVGFTGAMFIVLELVEQFFLMPRVRAFMIATARDTNDKKWTIDPEKMKDIPKMESLKIIGLGCTTVIFALLYYCWLAILLLSPVCFWFAVALICLVLLLTVAAKTCGVLTARYKNYKYVDSALTVMLIVIMIYRVIITR